MNHSSEDGFLAVALLILVSIVFAYSVHKVILRLDTLEHQVKMLELKTATVK